MRSSRFHQATLLSCLTLVLAGGAKVASAQQPRIHFEERSVKVGDVTVHYRVGGNGPPLLLIHGFAFEGHQWDQFADALGQQYTLIVPDLPGHGQSTSSPGAWSYKQVARDMFKVLDHLGFEKASGIGYSAGGNTLIHMATQQPQRLLSMVLVAGAHRLTVEARDLARTIHFETMPPEQQQEIRASHSRGDQQIQWIYAQLRGLADNYEDFDFSPEHLASIPVRTLLIWGDRDEFYPLEVALELYEALPNASFWVLPEESHLFLASDAFGGSRIAAELFAPTILRFLRNAGVDGQVF